MPSDDPRPSTIAAEALAGYGLIARVVARLARHLDVALARERLSLPQYRILVELLARGSTGSPAALAGKLGVSAPSVTKVVDGLVARGLLDRQGDTRDRRRQNIVVTESGLEVLAAAQHAVEARLAEIASYFENDAQLEDMVQWATSWDVAMNRRRFDVHSRH